MNTLNEGNIIAHFCALSGLTEEETERYSATVASAARYFSRLLKRTPLADEAGACEYACACRAFYDYATILAATQKTYSTQSGSIYARLSDDRTVINAENLWNNALAALPEDLVREDNAFMFEGVPG